MTSRPAKQKREEAQASIPLEVVILTKDHEIQGIVYVLRDVHEDRRISELLNDPSRRFLAVTEAKLSTRSTPSTPRVYSFLQLHIDNIVLIHPSVQSLMRNTDYSKDEALRFDAFRDKLNSVLSP